MYKDLEEKLDNFYDLEEHESDALLAEINLRARQNPNEFKSYLAAEGFGSDTYRTLFYEAIWTNPKGFDVFFIEELQSLLQQADAKNEGAIEEMDSLFYLCPIEDMTSEFYDKATPILEEKLISTIPEVRQNVAEVLLSLKHDGLVSLNPNMLQKIERLLYDPIFEVRSMLYISMEEMGLLPEGFKLPLSDRMRMKISGF